MTPRHLRRRAHTLYVREGNPSRPFGVKTRRQRAHHKGDVLVVSVRVLKKRSFFVGAKKCVIIFGTEWFVCGSVNGCAQPCMHGRVCIGRKVDRFIILGQYGCVRARDFDSFLSKGSSCLSVLSGAKMFSFIPVLTATLPEIYLTRRLLRWSFVARGQRW